MRAVTHGPLPAPSSLRPGLPPVLDDITLRALARDPARRFPTAEALRVELDRFLADRTYVPQSVQLGNFLLGLFGPERAHEKLRWTHGEAQGASSPGTDALPPPVAALRADDAATTRTEPPSRPASRRWAWGALVVIALAVAGALVAAGWERRSTPAPAPAPPLVVEVVRRESAPPPPPAPVATLRPAPPRPPKVDPSLLTVVSNAPVEVRVDGDAKGKAPLRKLALSPGRHTVTLVNPALGLSRSFTVRLSAGEEKTHRVEFQKGKLNVSAVPWADVFLDGKHLGQTPLAGRELWEGRHTLRLVSPRGEKTLPIEVQPGQTVVVREQFP
jgi:serine/threonine-protein kinase